MSVASVVLLSACGSPTYCTLIGCGPVCFTADLTVTSDGRRVESAGATPS